MVDVILVDDDKIILKILSKKLEKLGLSVLTYQDSKLGLESIVANKPKVAILDLVMPGYSGSDLAIKLSENLIFQT
ncbi:MAG: DNA-binding response regulator, partial [Bdellovibrio sp. CG_4_9_14_3_um_filter_39_7]